MSHKLEQVESTLHRSLAEVLTRELNDPRTEGSLISITRVEVSPDLRHASVFVSVLPEKHRKRVLAALKHASRHLHTQVKKRVALRIVPHLDFRFDTQLRKQQAVLGAIHEALQRTGDHPADEDGSGEPQDEGRDITPLGETDA